MKRLGTSERAKPKKWSRCVGLFTLAFCVSTLLGCTNAVAMEPAEDAVNPNCAEIIVRLPDTVAELNKRETNAQATGAWGDPAQVLLRCGVPELTPSALPCLEFGGVDWLIDDSSPTFVKATTYASNPATEVVIDSDVGAPGTVLDDLSDAVDVLPQSKACQ